MRWPELAAFSTVANDKTAALPPLNDAVSGGSVARGKPARARRRRPWSLLLAGLWLVAVIIHALLSGRWWLMFVPDLVPPFTYAVVPVLILVGALAGRLRASAPTGRVTTATVCLVLASLTLGWSSTGLQTGVLWGGRHGGTPNLRVVQWNTRLWGMGVNRARFFQTIRAQQADVYLLQEYINADASGASIYRIDQLALLKRYFPGYHIGIRGELVTLSRLPVISEHLVGPGEKVENVPKAPWQEVFSEAKVLRTDVRVGTKTVSLYNVHIPVQLNLGPSPLGGTFYRLMHANDRARKPQFLGLEKDLRANANPSLVAGDFNTSPAMGDLRTLRGMLHDVADAGSSLYPISWNQQLVDLWRLDWAFTQHGITADSYTQSGMDDISDHRASVMRLTV